MSRPQPLGRNNFTARNLVCTCTQIAQAKLGAGVLGPGTCADCRLMTCKGLTTLTEPLRKRYPLCQVVRLIRFQEHTSCMKTELRFLVSHRSRRVRDKIMALFTDVWLVVGWLRVQIAWTSSSPDTHMFPVHRAFVSFAETSGVLIHQLVAGIHTVSAWAALLVAPGFPNPLLSPELSGSALLRRHACEY